MSILFFDTETSDMSNFKQSFTHSSQPHLVQFGAIMTDDEGKDISRCNLLIKPSGWKIEEGAEKVHGISIEHCNRFGIPELTMLSMFNSMVESSDLIVCHNTQFDILIMQALAFRLSKPDRLKGKDTLCTMKAYSDICKIRKPWKDPGDPYKWPKLQEVYMHIFDKNFENAHDALADVSATKDIFFHLDEDHKERFRKKIL